jgi:membrane-bound serine protease (ClpP class)
MSTSLFHEIPVHTLFQGGALALWTVIFLVLLLIIVTVVLVITQRNRTAMSGTEMMVGMEGVVRSRIDPEGEVFVNSELWKAQSLGEVIEKGDKVKVRKVNGLLLTVEKIEQKGD